MPTAVNYAPMTNLPTSGVNLIKEFKGCNLHAYPDPHTGATEKLDGGNWQLGETIIQSAADSMLIMQLERGYLPHLQKIPAWNDLTENQKGAILSFGYNLGANFYTSSGFTSISTLLRNPERWKDVAEVTRVFSLYCNPGSQELRRREAQLWLT